MELLFIFTLGAIAMFFLGLILGYFIGRDDG